MRPSKQRSRAHQNMHRTSHQPRQKGRKPPQPREQKTPADMARRYRNRGTEDTYRHGQKIPQPRNGRHLQIWTDDTYNQSESTKSACHHTYLHPRRRNLQLSLHSIRPRPWTAWRSSVACTRIEKPSYLEPILSHFESPKESIHVLVSNYAAGRHNVFLVKS
jgi:hypothetical protein